ncbi:hypothetical protein PG996_014030 [Apiospora saccharicola]|uniref:AAA+ ATPase domain-containing protein n=1 Tax=Apiospora saccharicola TaxID=335842 RepID=A0ABR1TJ29_9PEZI
MESTADPSSPQELNQAPSDGAVPSDRPASPNAPVTPTVTAMEAFDERFKALDAKLTLVNNIFNLQGRPTPGETKGVGYESDPSSDSYDSDSSDDSYDGKRVRDVMDETVKLLGQLNLSHEQYQRARRRRRRRRRANSPSSIPLKTLLLPDTEVALQISTTAYLEGKSVNWVWMHWPPFARLLRRTLEESTHNPIVAVIGELDAQVMKQIRPGFSGLSDIINHPDGDTLTRDPVQGLFPERVKIHSPALYSVFLNIADIDKMSMNRMDGMEDVMVFIRPFREFIYNEEKLRNHLAKLESRFDDLAKTGELSVVSYTAQSEVFEEGQGTTSDRQAATKPDVVAKNDKEPLYNSITALLHLRCLIKFFDDEIKPKLGYCGSDQCRKVLFHDLWHIYKPGDEVVDQFSKRAFRVIRVQSPHHLGEDLSNPFLNVRSEDENSKAVRDRQIFKVHCAYIDYNGKEFGPVKVTFSIFPFGGLKDIDSLLRALVFYTISLFRRECSYPLGRYACLRWSACDIDSLPIYPLRLAKNTGLRDRLVARGRMLLNITNLQPMYYTGTAFDTGEEIDSQVIVDHSEALADEERKAWAPIVETVGRPHYVLLEACKWPCCYQSVVSRGEYIDFRLANNFVDALVPKERFRALPLILSPRPLPESILGTEYEPKEEDFLIMSHRAFGFVLRTRKWAQLDLTYLRYENQDARDSTLSAFDRLELPSGHREMVKSLVTQHFRGKRASSANVDRTDMIRGKGKGLIMLLHGAPGVGKTTTAEGVAELFQKPLFHITCGDLGTTAREAEHELEKNFALASRWGCILLLDEADVFLSARERKDFERNGLVAVFLRVLEYYTGILFLTTNRIGDFDEAFASRIHMSLHYPELDELKTKKVFKLNLDLMQERFDRQGRKIIYDRSSIENFAEQHFRTHVYSRWNGRQIRNACQTALALAEYDAHGDRVPEEDDETDANITVALELRHFQLVQTAYLDFAKYLGDIRGTEGDRRAIDYGLRAKTQTPYQTMEPGYPSTPSNSAGLSASRYPARPVSTSYNSPYGSHLYPPQASQVSDPTRLPVSQDEMSGADSAYTAGPASSMGPQIYRQHGQLQGQTGLGGIYDRQANPQGQGYSHPGNQPRLYQSSSQSEYGQGWGSSGPAMNQGYPPASGLQQGQSRVSNPQWQSPQGQQPQQQQQQGHSIYRSNNLQQGGGIQGSTIGEGFVVPSQTPYGGQGGAPGA